MYNRDILSALSPDRPYDDDRPAVFPDAPTDAVEYVFVGEAPGKQEVKKGRVFVGPSGQLLRDCIAEAGITKFHLTNSSLWRPTVGREDVKPNLGLVKQERPRLLMEISMLQPKAIMAMGATAWYALLGLQARMRGMVKEITIHGRTYPVYLTWHPAAVLYEPDYYPDLVTDLSRLAADKIPDRAVRPVIRTDTPPEHAILLSIDIEATSAHPGTGQLLTFTLSDGQEVYAPSRENLIEYLERYKGRLVAHNGIGDEIILRREGVPVRLTDDSLLLHLSQDERKGSHRLKALGPIVAGIDTGIDWVWGYTHGEDEDAEEQASFADIPMEDLLSYCGQDSLVTHRLVTALEATADVRTTNVYEFLKRTFRAFADATAVGVRVDQSLLQEKLNEQEAKVTELRAAFGFNPESNPQTVAAFREAGYRVSSVAKSVLADLEGDLPERYTAYRGEHKILTAFLRPLQQWLSEDGRVRNVVKIHGTDSGRTSNADPNLQQVPDSLRNLFIASEGHVLVGWDYKVHEVRGIQYYAHDPRLGDILADPAADPHQIIADLVGVERRVGKGSIFAVGYGASPGKLVKQFGLTPKDARRVYDAVRKLFPTLDSWKETVYQQIEENGYVETPYGRRRNFYYMDGHTRAKQERVAVNFLVQSLCGDVALESAVSVYEELGYPPILFVHDFTCIEVPIGKEKEVAKKVLEIGSAILPNKHVRWVPEIKVGGAWGSMLGLS